MDFEPHCENQALRVEAPGPPNEVLAASPTPSLLFSPEVPTRQQTPAFREGLQFFHPSRVCPGSLFSLMPVLLSADFSYNSDHLSEVFPGSLIRTTCDLQVLLFSTDRARCGQLMGTRCEPSRTCPTCMAIILQITFLKGKEQVERVGRRKQYWDLPQGRSRS